MNGAIRRADAGPRDCTAIQCRPSDVGAHMKTTVEIADRLLIDAKRTATREGTTLRALVEAGLREQLALRRTRAPAFKLRTASFTGRGLRPDLNGASWDQMREMAYDGRGT